MKPSKKNVRCHQYIRQNVSNNTIFEKDNL